MAQSSHEIAQVTAHRLKNLRRDYGLNIEEVCRRADIDDATYNQAEGGAQPVGIPAILKLAKFYNISPEYIKGVRKSFGVWREAPILQRLAPNIQPLTDEEKGVGTTPQAPTTHTPPPFIQREREAQAERERQQQEAAERRRIEEEQERELQDLIAQEEAEKQAAAAKETPPVIDPEVSQAETGLTLPPPLPTPIIKAEPPVIPPAPEKPKPAPAQQPLFPPGNQATVVAINGRAYYRGPHIEGWLDHLGTIVKMENPKQPETDVIFVNFSDGTQAMKLIGYDAQEFLKCWYGYLRKIAGANGG